MNNAETIAKAITNSLNIIEQEREREIISRRFGLNGHKETLEQIGEMLSITRERVRQLEKAILIRLENSAEDGKISDLAAAEKLIIRNLTEMGRVARISDLASKILGKEPNATEKAQFCFLGEISPNLSIVSENDKYHTAIGIAEYGSEKDIRVKTDEIVAIIKTNKAPMTVDSSMASSITSTQVISKQSLASASSSRPLMVSGVSPSGQPLTQRTFATRFLSSSKRRRSQCTSAISQRQSPLPTSNARM